MPDLLRLAVAMRDAADFCENPNTPKIHGRRCIPPRYESWEPQAVAWCAIGWIEHQLGGLLVGPYVQFDPFERGWVGNVAEAFDHRHYALAARMLRDEATRIEAGLLVAEPSDRASV